MSSLNEEMQQHVRKLERYTLDDVVKQKPRQNLISIDRSASVEEALKILAEHRILSLPIHDEARFIGIVNIMDLVLFICFGSHFSDADVTPTVLDTNASFNTPISVVTGLSEESKQTWMFDRESKLPDIMEPFSLGIHRVLVPSNKTSRQPDVTEAIMIENEAILLTQTDLVNFLYRRVDELGPMVKRTIGELSLASDENTTRLLTISPHHVALEGFRKIGIREITAVAVTDDTDKVIGTLSSSDLRGITRYSLGRLFLPVMDFLKEMHSGHVPKPITCTLDMPLIELMKLVCNHRLHRVWVVHEDGRLLDVVTLSDILRKFSRFSFFPRATS
jgi:5'-AMP-activated protein kinase regulatory gamma subunit